VQVAMTDMAKLPMHSVIDAEVPGRSGTLSAQGPVFLPLEGHASEGDSLVAS